MKGQANLDAVLQIIEDTSDKLHFQSMQIREMKDVTPSLFSEKSQYAKHFREVNESAAEKHGFAYIAASKAAINVVQDFGLNIDRPEIRALTASIVLAILDSQ